MMGEFGDHVTSRTLRWYGVLVDELQQPQACRRPGIKRLPL
jgi:hypothetical protein